MWTMIHALIHTVWRWLPAATITLKFCTAVIGFAIVGRLAIRRLSRIWRRHHKHRP